MQNECQLPNKFKLQVHQKVKKTRNHIRSLKKSYFRGRWNENLCHTQRNKRNETNTLCIVGHIIWMHKTDYMKLKYYNMKGQSEVKGHF